MAHRCHHTFRLQLGAQSAAWQRMCSVPGPNKVHSHPMRLCGAPHVKGSLSSSSKRTSQVAHVASSNRSPYSRTSQALEAVRQRSSQVAAAAALAVLWLMGCSTQASAGILPRSSMPQLESMVIIAPQATVTASVATTNDSMLPIVAVCLGFVMLSATISAAIGALLHMSGRPLQYGTHGAANWSTAGIMDTFDIMPLPLAYEDDEPSSGNNRSGNSVLYMPWEGPESAYIPVNSVQVLQPGPLEARLVARRSMLQPEQNLSIISITSSGKETTDAAGLLENSNGKDHISGKNGHSSNGSKKS